MKQVSKTIETGIRDNRKGWDKTGITDNRQRKDNSGIRDHGQ